MTSLVAFAIFAHSPQGVSSNLTQSGGTPPPGYAYIPWSPDPTSVGASISGPSSVSKGTTFVHSISMTDSDTFTRTDNRQEVVKGTSKLLVFNLETAGVEDQDGNNTFRAFYLFGDATYPTFTDGVVVAEVAFHHDALAPDSYPLTRRCRYSVTDPVEGIGPNRPVSTKDLPSTVVVGRNVEVTAS